MNDQTQFDNREWLETNGLGGFASGTVSGVRTRRYHSLLLVATTPPTGRLVLVNGIEAWLECDGQRFELSAQHYQPGVIHPAGHQRIDSFDREPWPTWTFQLENGITLRQEIFTPHETACAVMRWSLLNLPIRMQRDACRLFVRPLLSGRDYHSLHHENGSFRFGATINESTVTWNAYEGVPSVCATTNANYLEEPIWYRNFLYAEELERGLDCTEDLASPGVFAWNVGKDKAVLIFDAMNVPGTRSQQPASAVEQFQQLATIEKSRRQRLGSRLERSADQYIVRRLPANRNVDHASAAHSINHDRIIAAGKTIVAGYPWFTDWGRDTFIALRGLCIANGRLDVAREILLEWTSAVSQGMLPNRFPDNGEQPEYNSVDASLWFVIAAYEFLQAADGSHFSLSVKDRRLIVVAIEKIVIGYASGTRFGIRVDDDGLLFAGQPGVQLTWMDAKVGDWVVTPRIGKPVEIQALWLNALWIMEQLESASFFDSHPNLSAMLQLGRESFLDRFWNKDEGYLFDVIDVDFEAGKCDASFRPNQILAVGGLPISIVDHERGRQIVAAVESRLLTPLGLRSLDREHSDYKPFYRGDVWQRDGAYHQGTVWPWLIGPFVEAWLNVHGDIQENRESAISKFIKPLMSHLEQCGLDHISEIADAESPYTGRGCPFQAWSLAELIRLQKTVLNKEYRQSVNAPRSASTAQILS